MATVQSSWKKRVSAWGLGYTANFLMTKGFNFGLYPAVIGYFGPVKGCAIMVVLSFFACYATLKFYDWSKTDWLGIETIKEVRDAEEKGRLRKFLRLVLSSADWIVLLVLSILYDAFICTVYMRRGAHQYDGMQRRDWIIFTISIVISTVWWSMVIFTGLTAGGWILEKIADMIVMAL